MRRRLVNSGGVVHETSVWGASACVFHATNAGDAWTVGGRGGKLVEPEGWRQRCPEDSPLIHFSWPRASIYLSSLATPAPWCSQPLHSTIGSSILYSEFACETRLFAAVRRPEQQDRISELPDLSPPRVILANSCQVTKNRMQQQEHPIEHIFIKSIFWVFYLEWLYELGRLGDVIGCNCSWTDSGASLSLIEFCISTEGGFNVKRIEE